MGWAETPASNYLRQENVEQGVGKTHEHPGEPDEQGRESHLLGAKETTQMSKGTGELLAAGGGADGTASLKLVNGEGARAVVLLSHELKGFDDLGVVANAKVVLRGLLESHNGNSGDGHDKDERATGEENVAPAHVFLAGAGDSIGSAVPLGRDEEAPSKETSDGLTKTPPASHEGKHPLLVTGEVLEEDGRVQDEVAATTEGEDGNHGSESRPVGHSASDDTGDRADEQGNVESILAADDIGAGAPEDGTKKHTSVDGDVEGIRVANLAKLLEGRASNDRLDKENKGIDTVAMTFG